MIGKSLLFALSMLSGFEELRFANIHRQVFDSSCGYAAVASLMADWYGDATNEVVLINERLATADLQPSDYLTTVQSLVNILVDHGYYAKAYLFTDETGLIDAINAYSPVIVHYNINQGHFALALYADEQFVIVADPALGTEIMTVEKFKSLASGYAILTYLIC